MAKEDVQKTLAELSRELQESKARLEEAQRVAHVGHWEWDLETDVVVWSDETYRILGVDRSIEPTIDVVLKSVHPDDRELVRHQIARALKGGQAYEYEHRLLMPDGSVKRLYV